MRTPFFTCDPLKLHNNHKMVALSILNCSEYDLSHLVCFWKLKLELGKDKQLPIGEMVDQCCCIAKKSHKTCFYWYVHVTMKFVHNLLDDISFPNSLAFLF